MIITTESSGEPSANNAWKNDNRFQRRYRPRKFEQNHHPAPSTSQQSSVVGSSMQQVRPQQRTHEHNLQSLPKSPGHTIHPQHRPTGVQRGPPAQCRIGTTPSSDSSNNRSARGQATGQTGYHKRPWRPRPSRYPPASQDASTANNS